MTRPTTYGASTASQVLSRPATGSSGPWSVPTVPTASPHAHTRAPACQLAAQRPTEKNSRIATTKPTNRNASVGTSHAAVPTPAASTGRARRHASGNTATVCHEQADRQAPEGLDPQHLDQAQRQQDGREDHVGLPDAVGDGGATRHAPSVRLAYGRRPQPVGPAEVQPAARCGGWSPDLASSAYAITTTKGTSDVHDRRPDPLIRPHPQRRADLRARHRSRDRRAAARGLHLLHADPAGQQGGLLAVPGSTTRSSPCC